jgi:hypothetical protein
VYAFSLNMYRSCANIPLQNIARKKANLDHLLHVRISSSYDTTHSLLSLQSRATRPPVGYRRRPISAIPIVARPPPKRDPQHPAFSRLTKLLHFCADADPVRHIQPRDPLDVCFLFFTFHISHYTQHLRFSSLLHHPYLPQGHRGFVRSKKLRYSVSGYLAKTLQSLRVLNGLLF